MLKKLTEYCRGRAVLRIEPRYENSFLRMLLSEKIPAKVYELTENGEKINPGTRVYVNQIDGVKLIVSIDNKEE